MDLWKSELRPENSVLAVNEQFVESPKLSSASNSVDGSPESYSYHLEPLKIEITPKAALLAKKRLQAYCSGKTDIGQEPKSDNSAGNVKEVSYYKSKKIYPDESAKATVRDIELLKSGYGYVPQGPSPLLSADITDSSLSFSRADSHSPSEHNETPNNSISEHNRSNMFKKREIKCRNIRKNEANPRKSPSPSKHEEVINEDDVKKQKVEYPKNWTEYKEMRLNTRKDGDLKFKLFKKSRDRKFEFKKYFTFEAPSAPLETLKLTTKSREHLTVPFSYLRCTASKPAIMYSESLRQGSRGFLSRKQLFTLIPKEQKEAIEKLEKFSRCQPDDKPAISGKWYPKTWRKVENSEAMLLEQSIGLSFLQGYSDEEDTTTKQDVIQNNDQQEENSITEVVDLVLDKPIDTIPTIENENFCQEEDLTPQGTPKIVSASLSDDFEEIQDDLRNVINAKRSRWENEQIVIDDEEIQDLSMNDYEETRKELEKLEASLEPLELSLEGSITTLREDDEGRKERKKRRRKHKADVDKAKKKKSSRKTSSSDSESHVHKKRKKKKGSSKGKFDKSQKRKTKKRKLKKIKEEFSSGSESEVALEVDLPKKKKKKRFESKRIKNNSEDSLEKKHLDSDAEENYEADIKFFADRLDAEKRLKGKSKNREVKTIIVLDDLNFQENKDKPIKEEIKVDLLKLNEDYLREQKKKDLTTEPDELKKVDEVQIKQEVIESFSDHCMMLESIPIPPETKIEEPAIKRKCSESVLDAPQVKKVKLPSLELIPLSEIKLEKDLSKEPLKELEKPNCWESDEELFIPKSEPVANIELPPTLLLENIKVEKDILNIEDLQKKTAALIAEGEKRLKKESTPQVPKLSINVDPEFFDIEMANNDNQWEFSPPKVKVEVIDLDTNNSNSCAMLENEYEEFIKSVSTVDIPELNQVKSIEIDSSSDSSLQLIEDPPVANFVDISTVHIPLPPLPVEPKLDETMKPVPVPSPKIEAVLDLNKPMINLSLSANVTQNITLSLATSIPSISTPTTTSINFSKPNVEISNDTMVSMNNVPLPLHKTPSDIKVNHFLVPPQPPEAFINISPPKVVEMEPELGAFTSISLPSKKLSFNSNVKLDDSDPEDQPIRLTKLEQHQTEDLKQKDSDVTKKSEVPEKSEKSRRKSSPTKRSSPRRGSKRESSPRSRRSRESPGRKRLSSPRRRPLSPRRRSPGRRSPFRRRRSPGKRISLSPRRRLSPMRRRRSPSPKRRSPHKSRLSSPRRRRSFSPKDRRSSRELKESKHSKSPIRRTMSPLKRNADSTISDEQLEMNEFERTLSPRRSGKEQEMDISRMAQMAEMQQHQYYQFEQQYSAIQSQVTMSREMTSAPPPQNYKQVGNMLQIVPAGDVSKMQPSQQDEVRARNLMMMQHQPSPDQRLLSPGELRPKILQVGNMLQIVPTDIVPSELVPPEQPPVTEIKTEKFDPDFVEEPPLPTSSVSSDKSSPEAAMLLKVAERRAEREKRRIERERRRKEKEKRRKEKEKIRQAKLKIKTENMIKKALELEEEEESELLSDQPTAQWPPTSLLANHLKEPGKSILVNRSLRSEESLAEERKPKAVHFADGVRPGEGTSPSAGEELTSPPPPDQKLPKEKRYKKLKFSKKGSKKKKVKVRIVRRPPTPLEDSDSEDNLPPPSPPPGSPPPHVFPPRLKAPTVNNVPPAYLATIMQAAQHPQQLQHPPPGPYQPALYRPPIGMMMAPIPQGHLQPSLIQVPSHNLVAPPQPGLPPGHLQPLHSRVQSPHGSISVPSPSPHMLQHTTGMSSHIQSPHAILPSNLSVPPPPLPPPHNPGHSRHY